MTTQKLKSKITAPTNNAAKIKRFPHVISNKFTKSSQKQTIQTETTKPPQQKRPNTNKRETIGESDRGISSNRYIHASDVVVLVAGDVEPGAGVHKVRIPALEHVVRVGQAPAKRRQRVPLRIAAGLLQKRRRIHHSYGQKHQQIPPCHNSTPDLNSARFFLFSQINS